MFETWYILEDGQPGDPHEIGVGEDGILRHNDGRAVAYGPHGPLSTGVDAEALRAPVNGTEKALEPERPKRTYKTRQVKAD